MILIPVGLFAVLAIGSITFAIYTARPQILPVHVRETTAKLYNRLKENMSTDRAIRVATFTETLTETSPIKENNLYAQAMEFRATEENIDMKESFNFAILGYGGVGKSSLVNRLCGMADDDPRASPVGENDKTTDRVQRAHVQSPHVVFHDYPGVGVKNRKPEGFFADSALNCMDMLLIITATRVGNYDIAIAQEASKFNLPFIIVRNKSLTDANRKATRDRIPLREAIRFVVDDNQKIIAKQLEENQLHSHIFSIDTDDLDHPNLSGKQMREHMLQVARKNRDNECAIHGDTQAKEFKSVPGGVFKSCNIM